MEYTISNCNICETLKKDKILIRKKYIIIKDDNSFKCILTKHANTPDGCSSCIKGYMKKTLFLIALKYFNNNNFDIIEKVENNHLYYYTRNKA